MYAHTRHTSPTPPHYLATRLLLLDCCTRRFRPYTVPIQWPDGSARPPNCPPRLLCIVPASTAPPGVSRRLSVEEVPATPAMALMVMVVHILQRGVLRRSETEFCAVRSAHASREVLDCSLSCGRSVDAIGTLQRLMSTASVLEHRAHQRRQMKLLGAHQPRSRSVPGDRTRGTPYFHTVQVRGREISFRGERNSERLYTSLSIYGCARDPALGKAALRNQGTRGSLFSI